MDISKMSKRDIEIKIRATKLILATIDIDIFKRQLFVTYWSHFATSEANRSREVLYGMDNKHMTPLELEKDAFETAQRHINLADEMFETKVKLMNEIEELEDRLGMLEVLEKADRIADRAEGR